MRVRNWRKFDAEVARPELSDPAYELRQFPNRVELARERGLAQWLHAGISAPPLISAVQVGKASRVVRICRLSVLAKVVNDAANVHRVRLRRVVTDYSGMRRGRSGRDAPCRLGIRSDADRAK